MGTFSCLIEILSADGSRSETVDALVDTGSTYTCLPATLLHELGDRRHYRRIQSELPDGSIVEDAVGEARIRVEGIERSTIVIFAGEGAPAQLGAYTLEGALLVVDPVHQRLAPTHALRMASPSLTRTTWCDAPTLPPNPPALPAGPCTGSEGCPFRLSYINQQ